MRWVCFALRRALALKFASGWALRLWTPTPKMNNAAWAKLVPALGRAAMPPRLVTAEGQCVAWQRDFFESAGGVQETRHDIGEVPAEQLGSEPYRNSAGHDLAVQEMEDLQAGRFVCTCQYKRRTSLILMSYGIPQAGESISYLSCLLRGMPRRLTKCEANRYGPCGSGK